MGSIGDNSVKAPPSPVPVAKVDHNEEPAFHSFSKLPPEIRQNIFNLALQSNHVNLQPGGTVRKSDVFSPPPPALAGVCREARAVALRVGQPHAINNETKTYNSCWFQPSLDLLVMPSFAVIDRVQYKNRMCATSIWDTAQRVAIRIECCVNLPNIMAEQIEKAMKLPNIKHLFLSLGIGAYGLIPHPCTLKCFASSSHRIVPVDDEDEVNLLVANLLAQDGHRDNQAAKELNDVRHAYLDHGISKVSKKQWFRSEVLLRCEQIWLEHQYGTERMPPKKKTASPKVEEDGAAELDLAEPRRVKAKVKDGKLTNREHPWIQKALKKMPKISVVYILEAPTAGDNKRSITNRIAYEPDFIFNDEFKLWQKVIKKQMWSKGKGRPS